MFNSDLVKVTDVAIEFKGALKNMKLVGNEVEAAVIKKNIVVETDENGEEKKKTVMTEETVRFDRKNFLTVVNKLVEWMDSIEMSRNPLTKMKRVKQELREQLAASLE